MTALREILARQIAQTGPITLAEYMQACLGHPEHGYYTGRDPLGAAGDFITAPEISQMFGECTGLALAQCWQDQGRPSPFALVELGPGRGTLMADILRTARVMPGFAAAASLHLVEVSPPLRAVQAERLSAYGPHWHDTLDTLPDLPLFLVANEFFDALPIRQFRREGNGWSERMVGLDPNGALCFGQAAPASLSALAPRLADTREGDLVETCAPGAAIAADIGARIALRGGAALVVDYGDWVSQGDTLQAVQAHRPADPLAEPGAADLTAHVDFAALATAATQSGARASRLVPQGIFLERLGITQRATRLAQGLQGAALDAHIAAHRRLTHPQEMGNLFKVLGLAAPASSLPPGLTDDA